ncbi:hypothetical protein BGZ96_000354 [Linnemannia gamsii]|uniref:Uncharacterized protein n=1 Tax=Linnemannia gamsii TaxID=64522 RepID=A0ABQ7JPN2_9FUNG|nr:hypothetical protein BGZ96_000354 [Linnemannia gamsii]
MSGGAIAGLVIGILFVLVCSVIGGFLLLKKRRKRMMGRGQYNGYPDTSQSRDLKQDDDDNNESRRQGGLRGLVTGMLSKTQSLTNPKGNSNKSSATMVAATAAATAAANPSPADAMQQQQQQQQQKAQHAHRQQQKQQQQQQQQQLQHLPAQGYAVLPPAQEPAMVPQHQLQHQSIQQQQQQPVQMQQVQRSMVLPTTITTPTTQPYYYQPGTGLVTVPHPLPQAEPYTHQPFQPVQVAQVVTGAPPHVPYGLNNAAHYPAPPVSVTSVSHVPPPPSLSQQNQQHQQQLAHQQHIQQQQQPVAYQPPPPTNQATIPATAATVVTSSAATPRSPTPESGSIFLPGDSSRLLLSQGLFKIVPDAEDEEEAKRAAQTTSTFSSQAGPNPALAMDLNLGGDFLSSVLNYSSHQGPSNTNTFSSIPQGSTSNVLPAVVAPAAGSGAPGQAVRQQPGYHDRQAGQKDRPKNQPRYLVDKEEYVSNQQQHVQNGPSSNHQQNGEPVIVGSDIVFEPLPSVKAARERSSLNSGLDSTSSSSSSLLNNNNSSNNGAREANTKEQRGLAVKPTRGLSRTPTLGEVLPTMGTEEYLERTDDKEEYSARLHGARESSASASSNTATMNVVHPTKVGELSKEAQGGIVDIGTPITPNAILPTVTVAVEGTPISPTAAVIPPPRSSAPAPPPLRLSTKPKFK